MRFRIFPLVSFLPALLLACSSDAELGSDLAEGDENYTSATAKLLDFELDGEVVGAEGSTAEKLIQDQMLFTIGQLNGKTGVGRLDKLALTDVRTENVGELVRVRYHATLPVSLAKSSRVGKSYTLILPKRADYAGQSAFYEKYGHGECLDTFAHDVDAGIYWYYYRPEQSGCRIADDDVVRAKASVRVSPENTKNTYPEYDQIWRDDVLDVVAIFGKVEDGATTSADRGIWSHAHFVDTMRDELPKAKVTPAETPRNPGIDDPDVTIESTLPNGKRVRLTSFLVDNVRKGGPAFERRYNELSGDADVIVYNGHAGLGENVRALAKMGSFKPGKYQIVYMNGCDTFAYVDGTLAETRARLNFPNDPKGTKFMEIITNSMPPTWDSLPINTMSLVRDLMKTDAPLKYTDLLSHFDQSGFVAVTGDEDNAFKP